MASPPGALAEVAAAWEGLSPGATVVEPFGPATSATFGMLTDRFGVTWILGVAGQPQT